MASKSDRNKAIILSVLGALLIGVVVYQLFFSSPPPKPSIGNGNKNVNTQGKGTVPVQTPESAEKVAASRSGKPSAPDQDLDVLLADITPIDFSFTHNGQSAAVGSRGNIFEIYVEPPPPKLPPPPPPPITLLGVSPQSATAGTPRSFTLTIYGKSFPQDPEVYFEGRVKQAKRVNDGALTIEISPADYSTQKTVTLEVKSKSDPVKLFSNQTTFVVSPAPEPPFRFIGIIGEQGVLEVGPAKEVMRVRVGEKIQGVWRVDTIGMNGMELTHIQFDIKKRIPLQEKAK